MNKQSTVATIANEAIDQLQCACEHLRWFSALGKAIHHDLDTGRGHIAKDLGGLVQYLADDYLNAVDDHITHANKQLDTLELRA